MFRKKTENTIPVIDLTGPQGNAFFLLGYAKKLGKQIGLSDSEIDSLISKMMESDYENLLQVFDKAFGDYVILER